MTSTPRHPAPTSMKELKERNYKFYAIADGVKYPREMIHDDDYWPALEFIDEEEFYLLVLNSSQDSSSKLSLIFQHSVIIFEETKNGRTLNWHQLSDPILVTQAGFVFLKNNFYLQVMNRILDAWIPTGIVDKIVEDFLCVKRKFIAIKEPNVLTVYKLSFGFTIWLGCCGMCGLVFAIEIGYFIIKARLRPKKVESKLRKIKHAKIHPGDTIISSEDIGELIVDENL
ncbi:unnamed protein product [Chironomus riparius]|uniref:Uncharacterized protein n=1 Tax=Chironomus riparius TaxID=315576 RepID=A0A9N9WNR1_9DIPT|nr:unnamed protein product [Chironomus riparius]